MTEVKQLFPHQQTVSTLLDNLDYLGIFYEQGTGKTMCVLDWVQRNYIAGNIKQNSVLIITPKSALPMWERAIDNLGDFGHSQETVQGVRLAIKLTSFGRLYETHKDNATKRRYHTIRNEFNHKWSLIAVDEQHCIGSHTSIQTKMCLELSRLADKRVILTGTPISGGGGGGDYKKLYGQLLFLNNNIFGCKGKLKPYATWTQWKNRYVLQEDYFGNPVKYDQDQLNQLMKDCGVVARLEDCYAIPSTQEIDVPVILQSEVRSQYSKLSKNDGNIGDGVEVVLSTGGSKFIKMYELTSGFCKQDDTKQLEYNTSRLDALKTIIESTDDKVVVFCNFVYSINKCAELCSKYGKTVVYDGRSKTQTWREFQYGDQKYLICQYQSGGVAIDLFSSHTLVFYEPTLSALLLDQQKQRIRRKGQNKRCLYYHITLSGCCDVQFDNRVRYGIDVSNKVLDEINNELRVIK